jgi:hypothetical protein
MVLAALLPFAELARSQEPAHVPTPARTRLVVGLTQSPPFCMRGEDGSWSGISVELWEGIAADLGIDTEFRETTVTGLFDDLAPGRPLDVSIGALTITAEREDRLDFTQPFFLSGLGVAVKTAPGGYGDVAPRRPCWPMRHTCVMPREVLLMLGKSPSYRRPSKLSHTASPCVTAARGASWWTARCYTGSRPQRGETWSTVTWAAQTEQTITPDLTQISLRNS